MEIYLDENIVLKKIFDFNFQFLNEFPIPKELSWKQNSRLWGDQMHRICPYVAMFSPALAHYFIENYSREGDVILDTFSGRGTTMLQGRIDGRQAYAIDLNPFAYVLSKAKTKSFTLDEILMRINQWENDYDLNGKLNNYKWSKDLEIYYSQCNLKQLAFIKENYGKKWAELDEKDNFILAITLGLMHGPMRKTGQTIYFSLSMSNHTSMSKNYVKKYAKEHSLKKPEDNIFEKIRDRVKKIISKAKFVENNGFAKFGDALEIESYFPDIQPKLIFTSPPYLNIINYTQQNWIKMWMLGYDNKLENKSLGLDDRHHPSEYIEFMTTYLQNIVKVSASDANIILVIGDVKKTEKIYKFEDMWQEIKTKVPELYLKEFYIDQIVQKKKATNSMGSKAGKATRIDKIYVFKKITLV